MGRPVVATDVPGCRELVCDGQNGFLVPVRSPLALAEALEHFFRDETLGGRMGQKGRSRAETQLDAHKAADFLLREMKLLS